MIRPNLIKAALFESMNIETTKETVTDTQVRLLLRVPKGNSTARWLGVIDALLTYFEGKAGSEGSVDISKHYFKQGGEVRYSWRFLLQGPKIESYYEELAQLIRNVRTQVVQLEEVALQGSPRRAKNVRMTPASMAPIARR